MTPQSVDRAEQRKGLALVAPALLFTLAFFVLPFLLWQP